MRKRKGDDPLDVNYGGSLAQFLRSALVAAAEAEFGAKFRRARWPLTSGFSFEFVVGLDASAGVIFTDRQGDGLMVGPGLPTKLAAPLLPAVPEGQWPSWHDALRSRFKVADSGAVMVMPVRQPSALPPWGPSDHGLIVCQLVMNLCHHARYLGLPELPLPGARKEPRSGSAESKVLAKLRENRGRFVKIPGASNAIDRLRGYGFKIESATQARQRGAAAARQSVGWMLLE